MVTTGEVKHFEGKATVYVVLTCILAACGGLMFGYDVGISGKDRRRFFLSGRKFEKS